MVRALGQILLFIVLVVGAGAILRAIASAAFPGLGSPPRTGRRRTVGRGGRAMRSPAPRALARSAGHGVMHLAAEAGITNWLEKKRHGRQLAMAAGTATRPTIRQRLRLKPFTPPAAAGASGRAPGTSGNGSGQGTCSCGRPLHSWGACSGCGWLPGTCVCPRVTTPPENGRQDPGPQAKTPPASPASTNGGTNVAAGTSTASAEKLIEGINEIYAKAASGGIHAKQEAVKAAHEACVRFASMSQMLARTMSEPDQNYGPEITEPCSRAGQHLQAAAMAYSEADAALATLINMTVGDLATSPRQAPHHRELSENGAR